MGEFYFMTKLPKAINIQEWVKVGLQLFIW